MQCEQRTSSTRSAACLALLLVLCGVVGLSCAPGDRSGGGSVADPSADTVDRSRMYRQRVVVPEEVVAEFEQMSRRVGPIATLRHLEGKIVVRGWRHQQVPFLKQLDVGQPGTGRLSDDFLLDLCSNTYRQAYLMRRLAHVGRGALDYFGGNAVRAIAALPARCLDRGPIARYVRGVLMGTVSRPPRGDMTLLDTICRTLEGARGTAPRADACWSQVGHAVLERTRGQVELSLRECRRLAQARVRTCSEGVFREALAPTFDQLVTGPVARDPEYPCNVVTIDRAICYAVQPQALDLRGYTRDEVLARCMQFTGKGASICLRNAGGVLLRTQSKLAIRPADQARQLVDGCFKVGGDRQACMSAGTTQFLEAGGAGLLIRACSQLAKQERLLCVRIVTDTARGISRHQYGGACFHARKLVPNECPDFVMPPERQARGR